MDKDFIHPSLGFFIERTRKQSGVTIETLCKDLHISPSTYMDLKGRNASLSTYEALLRYYIDELEELDDDEIRKLAGEWVEKWLQTRKSR